MSFLKQNWFKLIVGFFVLLVGLSLFYYFVMFLPAEKRSEADLIRKQEEQKLYAEEEKTPVTTTEDALLKIERCKSNAILRSENEARQNSLEALERAKGGYSSVYEKCKNISYNPDSCVNDIVKILMTELEIDKENLYKKYYSQCLNK